MHRRLTLAGLAAVLAVALLLGALGAVTASTSATGSDSIAPVLDPFADPLPRSLEDDSPSSSPLVIVKTTDVSSVAFGDEIEFTLYVHNEVSDPVPALVFDPIADDTRYVHGSYKSDPPGILDSYDEETNAIYWQGDVEGGATVTIKYRVRVIRCDPHGFQVTNVAVAYAYGQAQLPASSSTTVDIVGCTGRDLGDAPDSTNHFDADMMAYPGMPAEFPTVFDLHTGTPLGPLHRNALAVHLGRGVSFERDADLKPDQDGLTNLLPIPRDELDVADAASLHGIANLDGFDDGVRPPQIEPCEAWVDLPVTITVNDPTLPQLDGLLYLNIWVDGNHNGRWGDVNVCESGPEASEWVLQDHEIPTRNLVVGTQVVTVTTLPVYREQANGGVLPAWMRVTLSEGPAPHAASIAQADGRGPGAGWALGETEDYYLPGMRRPVTISKTSDTPSAAPGDKVEYTITLSNPTAERAKVLMYDQIPDGTQYISDTFSSSIPGILEGYNDRLNAALWQGFVPGNETVVIRYEVRVIRCHPRGFPLVNTAWAYDYQLNMPTSASVRVEITACTGPDLGDAPDSSNHFSTVMTAYPAVPAEFPTVFAPATGVPPGPRHRNAFAVHLGRGVSFERDADLKPDQDGLTNLRPPSDRANRDRFDDAFVQALPQIAPCESWGNLPVSITVNSPDVLLSNAPLYLNMWVDGNHNGTWADTNLCNDDPVPEWVLQNFTISRSSLVTGTQVISVTTLPVYRTESAHGLLPTWLRITLSDGPVPIPAALDIPDGSGPDDGWALGETEDYYLPGDPVIHIDKVADKQVAAAGDEIQFTVTLSNTSGEPARVTVYDLIPPGTEYIPNSYHSTVPAIEEGYDVGTRPDFGVTRHWIVWRGDVPGNGTVEITFKARAVRCAPEGFRVINDAWAFEPGLPPVSATAVVEIEPCRMADLGDAPDSSNHHGVGMTAYGTVTATFPTVFDPGTGAPPGPMHRRPRAGTWLGLRVSGENDADLFPDQDGRTNLDPPADTANRDKYDDGPRLPAESSFPHCEPTEIKVVVTVAPSPTGVEVPIRKRFINVWFDWNRDGDWEDAFDCEDRGDQDLIGALEWAVRNHEVQLGPGVHMVTLPAFLPYNPEPEQDLWARVTLSDEEAPENPDSGLADGRGPEDGYRDGETEDYLIPGRRKLTVHKQVDKRNVDLGDLLEYTLTVVNSGSSPALNVHVEDPVPASTSFISGTLWASKPVTGFAENTVTWDGDVEAGETVTISFQVQVGRPAVAAVADLSICGDVVQNRAALTLVNGVPYHSNLALSRVHCPDLGDAPDSTNHFNTSMMAYPNVAARFPTVYDLNTGMPPGPAHWRPRSDAWLGYWVSGEHDADLIPDEDGRPNLRPPNDNADQDRADDGAIQPIRLRHCKPIEPEVLVNVPGPSPTDITPHQATIERYINVWFDWNRDGDWEDTFSCETEDGNVVAAHEWAVRDYLVTLNPGLQDVTLPALLPYNPTPHLPMWARITLSEQPAPVNPDSGLADGRGPRVGYRYGETEDYLVPGRHREPELKLRKRVDKLHASPGDALEYTIAMENGSNATVADVHLEDPIPGHTTYISGTLSASKPTANYHDGVVTWDGDVNPGELVTVSFKARVNVESDVSDVDELRCGGSIRNRAVLALPNGISMTSNEVHTRILCPDLGDAPDSTNHHGASMTTYPSVVPANFPTVFDAATGLPQGPIHWQPTQDAWLGPRDAPPTGERDADLMPDEDGRPNLEPLANKADQDRHDNGVFRRGLNLQHCEPATFKYLVTIVGPERERFVNVWFDWNRDGDWEDELDCPNAPASEWAVQNQVIALGPGTHVITTTTFLPHHLDPDDPMWMRITLAEQPVGPVPVPATDVAETISTDGSGPATGYRYGETEDYLLGHIVSDEPPDVWVTKKLQLVDFDDSAVDANKQAPARLYFHVEYGNKGGSTAADVVISDTLPISTTYKGSRSVPNIEPPTVVTPTVSWKAGALNPGGHGFIDVWFHVPAKLFQVLPPGTVLTNTASITTTTPGDDPSNNTSVITATIPLLPPRITWPIPGTTCTGTLTVTGKSQLGTFVDLYVDGVYTATATVDSSGNWDVPFTLSNGTHSIYAKGRTAAGDVSDPSPTVVIIVDDSLAWDPMSMTFTTVAPSGFVRIQHIRTEDGRADPDGWSVFLPTRITVTQKYTVSVLTCCSSPTVTLTVSNTVYTMTATGGGWYETVIDAPGVPNAPITLTVTCDGVTSSGSGSGLIDPDGYVFDVDVGKDAGELANKTVTALEYDSETDSWDRWPAELYESQTNPQVTGADGYYSFYTPSGDYQITVDESAGYQGYRSWTLTVISTPVHLDIPLTKAYTETQYAVTMDAAGFVPDTLEVVQGAVVQWTNIEASSGVWHTATSDADARSDTRGWDSGLLDSGESYNRRFEALGTFTYYDHENSSLVGTVKVCYLYDFDCDGKVGISDLQGVAQRWRAVSGKGSGYDARYDVDGNGQINIVDIQKVAVQWGWTAP